MLVNLYNWCLQKLQAIQVFSAGPTTSLYVFLHCSFLKTETYNQGFYPQVFTVLQMNLTLWTTLIFIKGNLPRRLLTIICQSASILPTCASHPGTNVTTMETGVNCVVLVHSELIAECKRTVLLVLQVTLCSSLV